MKNRQQTVNELLERVLDAGAELISNLPPDLGFQVEISLGELVVMLKGTAMVQEHPKVSLRPPSRPGEVN